MNFPRSFASRFSRLYHALRNARTVIVMCVGMACAAGAWGGGSEKGDFRWKNSAEATWSLKDNWEYKSDTGSWTAFNISDYPGITNSTDDRSVFLSTSSVSSNIVINLTENITIKNLNIETSDTYTTVTINLNGFSLTVTGTLFIGNSDKQTAAVNFIVNGSEKETDSNTLSVDTLKLMSSDSSTITLNKAAKLNVKSSVNNESSSQAGTLEITSDDKTGKLTTAGGADFFSTVSGVSINKSKVSLNGELATLKNTFKWIGADEASWSESANWKQLATDGVYYAAERCPGSANDENDDGTFGDTAVFDESRNGTHIKEFTVTDNTHSLTVQNNGTRIFLYTASDSYIPPNEFSTNGSIFLWADTSENPFVLNSLIVKSGITQISNLHIQKEFSVETGATANIQSSLTVDSAAEISGAITGIRKNSAGDDQSVVFNGSFTNNGSVTAQDATLTFNGDYSGTGSFTASSGKTVFNGNADFSGIETPATFNANNGTIYFINSESDSKTLKTFSGQKFNIFHFGGNVTIDAEKGDITVASLLMRVEASDSAYYLPSNFTAKITGGNKVNCTSDLATSRLSATDGVIGCLELDCDLDCPTLTMNSGSALKIDEGRKLSVSLVLNDYSSTDSNYSNAILVNGTLDASSIDIAFNYTTLTVGEKGSLSAKKLDFTKNPLDSSMTYSAANYAPGGSVDYSVSNSGTITSSSLSMAGSEENRFKVAGSGKFVVTGGKDSFTGDYLSLGSDVQILKDSLVAGSFPVTHSEPSAGKTKDNYRAVYENGWNFPFSGSYVWTGEDDSEPTKWEKPENWADGETFLPLSDYPNSTEAVVTIPREPENQPVVTENISVKSLEIKSGASLTLNTGKFSLYSQYSGDGTLKFISCELDIAHGVDIAIKKLEIADKAVFAYISDGGTENATVTISEIADSDSSTLENHVNMTVPSCTLGKLILGADSKFSPADDSTLTITDTWDNSAGGTFSHNNSTVVFGSASPSETKILGSEKQDFYNFTVIGVLETDISLSIAGGADFSDCTRITFSSSDNKITAGTAGESHSFKSNENAEFKAVELKGTSDLSGTLVLDTLSAEKIASSETIRFNSAASSISYSESDSVLNNIEIASSAILSLQNDITVSGDWTNNNTSGNGLSASGKTVTFTGENATISGDSTFANAIFMGSAKLEDSNSFTDFTCEKGGISLTFAGGATQTVSGMLSLKGSADNLLTLASDSESTIVVATEQISADYLSIGKNVLIRAGTSVVNGSHTAYTTENSSKPSAGEAQTDYITLYKHGWNLGYDFVFTWRGGDSSSPDSWAIAANWDLGIVPGLDSENTAGAKVSIPDDCDSYPLVQDSDGEISLTTLTVGSENSASAAKIALLTIDNAGGIKLTNADSSLKSLTNYGSIEYTGTARITDGANPVNDVENGGTVEYSGIGQTITNFARASGEVDYANLVISGMAETDSEISVSGNLTVTKDGNFQVKKNLSLSGNLAVFADGTDNGYFKVDGGKSVIFDGNDEQKIACAQNATLQFATVEISENAQVTTDSSFSVTENWTNNSTDAGFVATDGEITFSGADVTVSGKNKFNNLRYANESGSFTLKEENSFTASGIVTIVADESDTTKKAEVVTLSSDGSLRLGTVYCTSLEVQSSVSLTENLDSPVIFTGENAEIAGNGKTFAEDATFSAQNANLLGDNTFSKNAIFTKSTMISGSNAFSNFTCETAGVTLTFASGKTQTVGGNFTLKGESGNLVTISGEGEWEFSPDGVEKISLKYAKIANSKNTRTEPIVVYAKGGYNEDGGGNTNWIFAGQEYEWTGAANTNWNEPSNWQPASVPQKYSLVTIPSVASKTYPVLAADLDLANETEVFDFDDDDDGTSDRTESVSSKITIEENAIFDFAGNVLTVNTLENAGKIRVLGTEDLRTIENLPDVAEKGIIDYYGAFDLLLIWGNSYHQLEFSSGATGSISDALSVTETTFIANGSAASLSLTGENIFSGGVKIESAGILELSGAADDSGAAFSILGDASCDSLQVNDSVILHGNVTTTGTQIYKESVFLQTDSVFDADSSEITFNSTVSGEASLSVKSPVNFYADVTTQGSQTYSTTLTLFGERTLDGEVIFDSENEIRVSASAFGLEEGSVTFTKPVTSNCDLLFSADSVDFASASSFTQSDGTKSLTLGAGTALSFKAARFTAGELIIETGSTFTQTGENDSANEQTVYGIENNGVCVWDSLADGGTLVLAGSISGANASEVIFNKKNVSITANDVEISGVFYDLVIPAGISVTNGEGIAVRRNFTASGTYAHNDKTLTLGTVTVNGTEYLSAENESGGVATAGLIASESSSLGTVAIVQGTTRKKFSTNIEAISLLMNDTVAGAGSIDFAGKLTATSIENASGTDFAISFDSACAVTNAVEFGTSGLLTLGTTETSDCSFGSSLEHTAGDTSLSGVITASSAKFAKTVLPQNCTVNCADGSGTVIFTGEVTGAGTFTVNANSDFSENVTVEKNITFKASVLSSGEDVHIRSRSGFILADGGENRTWGAAFGKKLTFESDVFVDMDVSSSLTISSDISWTENVYLYSVALSSSGVNLSIGKNFVLFGEHYSSDDPRFSGTDERFSYFGYDSLSHKPSLGEAGFKTSFSANSTSISVGGNFYLNGLDFENVTLILPDQSSSHPVFNPTSSVTENQWGNPYAVAFNSTISNCHVLAETGAAFVAASVHQGNSDGSNGAENAGFQFAVPAVSEAYSVSDSVICVKFDMDLENSNGEVSSAISLVSNLSSGGIFYNSNGDGGLFAFDGVFYTQSDGTNCSVPLSESDFASTDIPRGTALYLKAVKTENQWNTDATATSIGSDDSTDRTGTHRKITTDLSFFEGLFYAADGKTMAKNYGIGLWKETDETEYAAAKIIPTVDHARPVLIDVFAGQELYSKNSGSADSQKVYDSHNFLEFRYSEMVDIGDLASGATENNQNIQAQSDFDSENSHGGAISDIDGGGLSILGFASIEKGTLTAGVRDGENHKKDAALPHALYRKFKRNAQSAESVQNCRIRISIAGFVDEENPVSFGDSVFNNWIGYINSSETPSGLVTPLENPYITDLAVDSDGNALKNKFDENNSSRTIKVNEASPSLLQLDSASALSSATSLYGDWDTLPPVFAPYIDSVNYVWAEEDSDSRVYEIVGTVDSNTSAYLDRVELHLFDNKQTYSSSDSHKWVSQIGWTEGAAAVQNHLAPENTGGSRPFSDNSVMTQGGIRRSSLVRASDSFTYAYSVDGNRSESREFAKKEISQNVKSPLFRNEELTTTTTENDGLYFALSLNSSDSTLPIRTSFVLTYSPEKSFITDLAGNRLIQTDSGKSTKTIRSLDITPPSFSIVLSPIGENKLYAVFTKPLAYKGTYLSELPNLSEILEKIQGSIEFVYSEDDNIDSAPIVTGSDAISVEKVELSSYSADYTSLLFTLSRKISLDDVEKIWLRINDSGDTVETFSGETIASYFQDMVGNAIPFHTCHAISDFAVNAVNVLYAFSTSDDDENWSEEGVYGTGLAPLSSDFAVHDFSADGGNYAKLRTGGDIVFQMQFVGGKNDSGFVPVQNDERLALVIDKKSNIRTDWISDKFNLLTGNDWRIWIDKQMISLSNAFNPNPMIFGDVFADVEDSEILKNMTLTNEKFNFSNKDEYQFFFKILDSEGNAIELNHDGDSTTPKIPLYAFRMDDDKIASQKFSFLDLWSFSLSDITKQRGGVTILNNVINAGVGEKCAIEVDMKSKGNLNIYIMTLDGNIVKQLSKGSVDSGTHYYYWDGKNNAGKAVARGLYFVRVSGNGIDETRKVMVVK